MIRAFWYGNAASPKPSLRNWGDVIAPYIIEAFAGDSALNMPRAAGRHLVVGSILHRLRQGDQVWGCGVISDAHMKVPEGVVFHAVRGPLTRAVLLRDGAEVPEVYGDPALLMPSLMQVKTPRVTHKRGILAHYVDAASVAHLADAQTRIIDICGPVKEVIRAVASCEELLASSLHGLILGDLYCQRAAWLTLEGGRRLVGRDFKFRDYLLSTDREPVPTPLEGLPAVNWLPSLQFDTRALIRACPFNRQGIQRADDLPTTLL